MRKITDLGKTISPPVGVRNLKIHKETHISERTLEFLGNVSLPIPGSQSPLDVGLSASLKVRKGDLHTLKGGAIEGLFGHEDGWGSCCCHSIILRVFLLDPSWGERNVREEAAAQRGKGAQQGHTASQRCI